MRLKLDLSLSTLTALFQPDGAGSHFPGPVRCGDADFHVSMVKLDGDRVVLRPIEWDALGNSVVAGATSLDLSIPWVHERIATTCLSLLGVKGARAACMTRSQTGTVYTLRWVDGDDGLPRTASWDRLGGAPVIGLYQNDLVSSYRLKLSDIPRIDLKPDATHDEALGALLLALDAREAGKVPTPATS